MYSCVSTEEMPSMAESLATNSFSGAKSAALQASWSEQG